MDDSKTKEETKIEDNVSDDDQPDSESLRCRFYEKDFPDENDLVLVLSFFCLTPAQVRIEKVHENGAYVVLLEYDNMEGLILYTEITRKRVNSVNRLVKVGKNEIMMVIRVDKEKRYIDLSRKKVNQEEAIEAEKYFKKAKMVHSIMKMTSTMTKVPLEELYERFGWGLYNKCDHAYDAMRLALK